MSVTKIFRSGNSLAVRIPAGMNFGRAGTPVEIVQRADVLEIRPRRRSLKGIMDKFSAFDPDFMAGGREKGHDPERKW